MTYFNKKTRITASAMGVLLGLAGIVNHGVFEILQGFTPTNGFYIEAIGEAHRFWLYGTEGAFTIIHNFLITGIFAVLAGLAIIVWSLKYIHTKHGTTIFLLLTVLLILVGGGIGFIIVFIPTWAFASQINKALGWWKKIFPFGLRKILSSFWIFSLAAAMISWLIVMELGIFGYIPGQNNPDIILDTVFILLFSSAFLTCISFICAYSGDINR
ncbi:hypothetical protein GM418_04025 [Maribellus comscasis]|uniref:Uncharacterized protein n=1 Tax=Maribellus comscasis TaxID=2681766 RepID=A0A6I6JPB2_9BACT|nr:hypothetical protein [Maribellus comscasis]QGY42850.1 hypothetical protein GM418_04025 [Maribellus comscasis]